MNSSQRGAARVNIIWLVTLIILVFVALGIGYAGFDEASKYEAERDAARTSEATATARLRDDSSKIDSTSRVLGWFDPQAARAEANVEAAKAALEDLKSTFTDLGPDVKTFEAALPVVKQSYLDLQRKIAQLEDTKKTLDSEIATTRQALQQSLNEKDSEIAKLNSELADERNNASQKQTELENRIASLNTQRNDLDAQLREVRGTNEELQRGFEDERQAWEVRANAMTDVLRFLDEPEAPDGEVLAVSKDLAIGWINLGAKQRLARGTRFRVVSGKTGSAKIKAFANVINVEPNRAEVEFVGITDRFDPVVAGDVVYNPLYDPTGTRHAVLAGRFSGRFNEAELRLLLKEMGIVVQEKLEFDTDYLIVGADLFVDEEGTPLEDPLPVSELAVYKNAEASGVQIISIKDLQSYFKF